LAKAVETAGGSECTHTLAARISAAKPYLKSSILASGQSFESAEGPDGPSVPAIAGVTGHLGDELSGRSGYS